MVLKYIHMALCISNLFTVIAIQYIRMCSHYILLPALQMINIQLLTIIPKKSYKVPLCVLHTSVWEFLWNIYLRAGTSLVVQWLRLHACNAGGNGSIPGWGRSHMLHAHSTPKKNPKNILKSRITHYSLLITQEQYIHTGYVYTFSPEINIILF